MTFTTITCVSDPRSDQLRLLFTNTDRLAYVLQTDDIYKDMADDVENRLDHPLYDEPKRTALGFFKYKLNSVPIGEIVGLRPKCYPFLCTGKVSNNVLQHTKPAEKKTQRERNVIDDHLHFAI